MNFLIASVGGFASGVFLRSLFVFGWPVICFMLLLAAILFAVPKLLSVDSPAPFERESSGFLMELGAALCVFVAFGMARAALADTPLPGSFAKDLRHRVSYDGTVVSDPDVRDSNQRVQIRVSKDTESAKVLAVAPRYPEVSVGDRVRVSGTLMLPEAFADESGRIFRYDKYLERDDVRFLLTFAYLRVESSAPWYSVPALLARIKHSFLGGLRATLPEPYTSLAGGIVIGGKSGLGSEVQQAFVRSGLAQIIVLSGYNVMVVAEWIMAALALAKIPKRWSAAAGAIAVLLFVGIAGASATALRAALMALIALFARATGRTYAAGRALLFVILLMLVWNPLYLIFDPGFGLSVAATAGLIWLAPIIETILSFMKNGFWKNALATTVAAQITVLPLLLYDTGNLSLVSVPANVLAMPFVPVAMALSAFAGFAGMLFSSFAPFFGVFLALPAYLANAYLLLLARESSALPLSAITIPPFPFWLALAAYAALIYFAASKRFSTTLQLRFARNAST